MQKMVEHPPSVEGGSLAIQPIEGGRARLRMELGGEQTDLLASALAVPYPSGLRRLAEANPDLEAVIVERIPPGLDKAARELGVSYLDMHGRGRVTKPGFVYFAPPDPNLGRTPGFPRSSPFAPKASRVVRTLLSDHDSQWRLSDVAKLSALNPGNVHRALSTLVEDGYLEREDDLYIVADPGSLLDAWADIAAPIQDRVIVPVKGGLTPAVETLVDRLHGKAVVSGELAAELLAPHLPAESALIHCLDVNEWARLDTEEIEPPPPPARIVVDLPDAGVAQFGTEIAEIDLVGPAQLYVDLYGQPTRGRQAAEEVRRQLLDF